MNKEFPPKILLRNCRENDYEFIHNLTRNNMEYYVKKYWGEWNSKKFKSEFNKKNIKIVECNGEIIGFYNVESKKDYLYFHNIQLVPRYQGQGIGSYLISLIEKKIKRRGINKILLKVFKENPARNFYLNLGYKITKDYGTTIKMEKTLFKK